MDPLSISELARLVGLRASAIRYYEQIGILPAPPRTGGRRRYDANAAYRLAVVRRAQEAGFTLDEIRGLFRGFQKTTPVSIRWRRLAERKLAELDEQMERIRAMKQILENLQSRCGCDSIEQCGAAMLRKRCEPPKASLP